MGLEVTGNHHLRSGDLEFKRPARMAGETTGGKGGPQCHGGGHPRAVCGRKLLDPESPEFFDGSFDPF